MRFPFLRTLSARILVGYAVVVLTFVVVTVLTLVNMERLSREIRVIRRGYLELALISKDLTEKQWNLTHYLNNELVGESSAARVTSRVRRFRAARDRLLEQVEAKAASLSDIPPLHARRMRRTEAQVQDLRREVKGLGPLYEQVLAAPPIERPAAELANLPGGDRERRAEAVAALEQLNRREKKLFEHLFAFQRLQRQYFEHTADWLVINERRLRIYTLFLGITAATVGLLMSIWSSLTLRPLRRLRDAARGIARGDYQSRIEERGPSEVADLAREFNTMAGAIDERERELVRSERLVAVGKMAAVITHEVRNPLSSIGLNTELLEEELAALPADRTAEARALCRAIHTEVDRLTAITEEYLQFARLPKPKRQLEDINRIAERVVGFEREPLSLRGVELKLDLAQLPPVLVDDSQLHQALLNLVRNAAESVEESGGGQIVVATRVAPAANSVEIVVADDGHGVHEDLLPKLFDPFFSTKEGGTGLGLAVTHQIIREHEGRIQVQSRPGEGATFIVSLPMVNSSGDEGHQ